MLIHVCECWPAHAISVCWQAAHTKRRGCHRQVHELGLENSRTAVPMSVFWLVPQYAIIGAAEILVNIGALRVAHGAMPAWPPCSLRAPGVELLGVCCRVPVMSVCVHLAVMRLANAAFVFVSFVWFLLYKKSRSGCICTPLREKRGAAIALPGGVRTWGARAVARGDARCACMSCTPAACGRTPELDILRHACRAGTMELFYSEAPDAMRSTASALQLLTVALGKCAGLSASAFDGFQRAVQHGRAVRKGCCCGRTPCTRRPRSAPCCTWPALEQSVLVTVQEPPIARDQHLKSQGASYG